MLPPKVLIFTPIYDQKDYCLDKFVSYVSKINYPNKKHIFIDNSPSKKYYYQLKGKLEPLGFEVYHIKRGNNSREALTRAQNFARKIAIDEGYNYLFSIESDIMVPMTVTQDLMKHSKDVVTAYYTIGNDKVRVPCITIPEYHENLGVYGTRLLKTQEEVNSFTRKGLQEVQAGGMGVCLMYIDVVKKFPFKYDPRYRSHSDVYFFTDCFNHNKKVFVDTDIICPHDNSDWSKVDDA